jgi:hypothetical protein
VLALYGFWREGAILPKDEIGGWPVFLVAILFVVIIGVVTALRNKMARNDGIAVVLIGVAGFVLALGAQGPFGSLFEWAYGNVPGFALMREPQKFAGLLALSYAYFFAAGAAHLIAKARTITQRRLNSLAAVILPVLYVPTLFFGLLHEVKAVDFPPSWEAADQLMGNGNGKVLALPWHQYMSYPFTDNRVVGSPVDALLRRDVISGDNTELAGLADTSPPRSRYIQFLLQNGPTLQSFGAQLRPLGVEYIVVTKAVDFNQYKWLRYQSDLEVVQETPDLVLYRNKHAAPDGYRGPVMQVADWGEAVGEVEANPDAPLVLQARALAPGVIRQPASALSSAQEGADVVKRKTQSAFKIGNGSGGVSIPAIYDDSWRAPNGASAVELASGNAGFRSDTPAGVASLTRWASLKRTYVISILALLVVVIGQFSRRQIVSASRFSVRRWLTSQGASRSSTK